ncbi:MAG: DUF1028 domain-containing protein [Chloroflexi bacterium]|nr:DUF1028 domain-containing protein [Chloroflexota bacterium]
MTYSIVARDAATGAMGVAVQSHFFSVGPVVPWAEAGVGAIATQSMAEPAYGPRGLDLMRSGLDAPATLRALMAADPGQALRQVAMVDARGIVVVHTGGGCIAEAGHRTGDGVSVQANMMERATVPDAMLQAYEAADGDLADRMLAALDAAEAEGGDIRGRQSAALLVVGAENHPQPWWTDRLIDLRVDDHPEPLVELRRLVTIRRAYTALSLAQDAARGGRSEESAALFEQARALLPKSHEVAFWYAVAVVREDPLRARELLREAARSEPRLRELVRRLPAWMLAPETAARLLAE